MFSGHPSLLWERKKYFQFCRYIHLPGLYPSPSSSQNEDCSRREGGKDKGEKPISRGDFSSSKRKLSQFLSPLQEKGDPPSHSSDASWCGKSVSSNLPHFPSEKREKVLFLRGCDDLSPLIPQTPTERARGEASSALPSRHIRKI